MPNAKDVTAINDAGTKIKFLDLFVTPARAISQTAANAGGPIASLNSAAPNLLTRIQKLNTTKIKSKYNFTV